MSLNYNCVQYLVDSGRQLEMAEVQAAYNAETSHHEKWHRPQEVDNNCPSCAEEVSDDRVQCQWCGAWEHFKFVGMRRSEYDMLSLNSPRITFLL